jgi:hypothetical protein
MDISRCEPVPLLLRFARPAAMGTLEYTYDPGLEVNVVADANGNASPIVEGPYAASLTKTVTVEGDEDRG